MSLWKNLLATHFPCLALVPDGPGSSGMLLSLTRVSSSNSELLELLRSIVGRKGHYYNFMYIYFFYCLLSGAGEMYIYIYIYYALSRSISNALHTYCTHVDKYEQALVVPANIFY